MILIVLFYLMYKKDPTVSLVTMIDAGSPIGFHIAEGEVWRYFTGMFLHGSWTHVIDNCIGLYILGRKIEAYYGTWRFILITLGIGLITNASFLFHMNMKNGASGVLYGYLAFYLYLFFFKREEFKKSGPLVFIYIGLSLIFIIYDLIYGPTGSLAQHLEPGQLPPTTDHYGHLFGFIGGFALYLLFDREKVKNIHKAVLASALALLLLLTGIHVHQYYGTEDYYMEKIAYLIEKKLPAKANYYIREYLNKFQRNS